MQETQEMPVQSLGWEDLLEEEMATHSSVLAWTIPWTEEPGKLQSIGLHRVKHNWSNLAHKNSEVKKNYIGIQETSVQMLVFVTNMVALDKLNFL